MGNNGVETETSNTWSGKVKFLTFRFPPMLIIGLNIYATGSLQYSVKYASDSKDSLKLSLSGKLVPMVELANSISPIIKLSASSDGTLIGASGDAIVSKSGITKQFKFYGTAINLEVQAATLGKILWKKSFKILEDWSY